MEAKITGNFAVTQSPSDIHPTNLIIHSQSQESKILPHENVEDNHGVSLTKKRIDRKSFEKTPG